jgi:outer membrane protein assembly factor BamB
VAYQNQVIYTGLDIFAFDAQTGDTLFQRLCNCGGRQDRFVNGAINYKGELVFYDEGRLLKLDLSSYELTGQFADIVTFEGDLVLSTPAIDSNNNIYFGSEAGILYSFDDNLALRWRFELPNPQVLEAPHIRSSVAIDESRDTLYFGTKNNEDSEFYALDLNTKAVKWKTSIAGDVYVSPTLDDSGNIYFSSETNLFYAYKSSGELAWQYDLKANVTWSSPVIDSQGIAYIGTLSESDLSASNATGKLVAINTGSNGLMPNTWAKIHRDNQNSGVAK